eukprot:10180497-Heterocapsa_arctica.AAC.1
MRLDGDGYDTEACDGYFDDNDIFNHNASDTGGMPAPSTPGGVPPLSTPAPATQAPATPAG